MWYYLIYSWKDKGVHTFPEGICPKGNIKAQLEFELAYYDSAVQHFNHFTTRTPPNCAWVKGVEFEHLQPYTFMQMICIS